MSHAAAHVSPKSNAHPPAALDVEWVSMRRRRNIQIKGKLGSIFCSLLTCGLQATKVYGW